jgi:hypothetical protein
MSKYHLIRGNHKSFAGIEDICLVLQEALDPNMTTGIFGDRSKTNLIIEDFSSKDYTKYILESDLKICLVLTEFMHSSVLGKIKINKFGLRRNFILSLLEDVVVLILRFIKIFLPRKYRLSSEKKIYWKNREVGLKKIIDSNKIRAVICLHPDIQLQAEQLFKNIEQEKIFTILPRLTKPRKLTTNHTDVSLVSFGTKNSYRKKQIRKFNESFPLEVILPSFLQKTHNKALEPVPAFVDIYFKNSKTWKYLSPIRFWRSLNVGSFVVYFGKESTDHPINKCAIHVNSYELFPKVLENFEEIANAIQNQIEIYDVIAENINKEVADKLISIYNNHSK